MAIFSGFSSYNRQKTELINDNELIMQDLKNHFLTRKGERIMNSDYGFIGWDLVFELKRPGVKDILEQDARRIIATEPRVTEDSIAVIEEEHGFWLKINLFFDYTETRETLMLFFDNNRDNAQT